MHDIYPDFNASTPVADILGCAPQKIVFTSGGSEANPHALKGILFASGKKRPQFIASSAKHPAKVAPLGFACLVDGRIGRGRVEKAA